MVDTESLLFWCLIAIVIVVIVTFIGLLIHAGLFLEIVVDTCKPYFGEIQIAYKFATGPYKEAGALFTEAHTLLPHHRTIGVYYDDPKKKEPSRLRYIVGLILSENETAVDPEERKLLEERGFKFANFPSINHAVQTSFPFKSTLSIIFAIFKIYPAFDEYIKMKRLCAHPCIEVYDNDIAKIMFVAPLEKQDDFYVPEVKVEDSKQPGDEEDDHSSVSWDDSASIIRKDPNDFDSDSVGDDSSVSISHASNDSEQNQHPPSDPSPGLVGGASQPPTKKTESKEGPASSSKPKCDEDSDNTSSSFEEIDEADVHSVNVTVSSSVIEVGGEGASKDVGAHVTGGQMPLSTSPIEAGSKLEL